MAISFSTSYADLGKVFAAFANINGVAGAQTPTGSSKWGTNGAVVKGQTTMVSDILTRLQGAGLTGIIAYQNWQANLVGLDNTLSSQKTVLQQLAQQILITRVNNDVMQQSQTSLTQALTEWIRQMQQQSQTVQQCVVSATTTAGANNTGNPIVYASTLDRNGLVLEHVVPETLVLKCTQDANHGGTAGSEQVTISSPATPVNSLSYLWPQGSGITKTVTVVDPTQGNGAGQNQIGGGLTTVGAFKAWTGAVPNGWTIDVDGTNISDGTSSNYAGLAHCLQFTGNTGGTNLQTSLYQNFANGAITGGSPYTVLPETVYHFTARIKASVVPAAGVLSISLTNGSGTVINDNNGVANTITVTVSGFGSTAYQVVSGSFRTPTIMPANVRLRIKATTPITTGTNVFVDYAALSVPPSTGNYGGLYAGGPYLSVTRGSADLVNFISFTIGDFWTVLMANDLSSSSPTPLSFQPLMNQLFGLANLGFVMPSAASGSNTVLNSLIS